ncbi:MAG: DUF2066 domain-containing protein [Marinicella sp.]
MKLLLVFLLFYCPTLLAVDVETDRAAALVDNQQMTLDEQTEMALAAVVSKKSGWSLDAIRQKNVINESFNSIILRNYYQKPPMALGNNSMWFNVVVDEIKLKDLMIEHKIPVWPDNRGQIFVWIVEESVDGELINAAPDSATFYWLDHWLKQKGVPARFYDYQDEDLLVFQPSDVRYLNPDLIDFVEQSTDVNAVLLVFVKHQRSGFSYRYGFAKTDQQASIKTLKFIELASGLETLASEIQTIMSHDQQVFADEFSQSTVSVKVNNLVNSDQVLKLLNYFDNHALIDDYHINQLKNGQLSAMMNINVLPDTFVKFVDEEQVLEHLPLDLGHSILFSMTE